MDVAPSPMPLPHLIWMGKKMGFQIGHSVHNSPTSIVPANVTHLCTGVQISLDQQLHLVKVLRQSKLWLSAQPNWIFNFGFQDFFWTSSCIWSKCSDDQNFACRKQPKLNQNCAEYQPRRHNFISSTYKTFCFQLYLLRLEECICFCRSWIKQVGFHLKVKSNPQSIRECKNRPFIEITFLNGQGFLKEKFSAKNVDKCESRILFSGKIRFHLLKVAFRNSKEVLQNKFLSIAS